MNAEWLLYLVRLTVIWSVLLLFYRLVLTGSRNWRLRRYFLLGTYLAGILIPLLPALPWSIEAYEYFGWSGRVVVGPEAVLSAGGEEAGTPESYSIGTAILASATAVWCLGMVWQVGRTFFALAQCSYWIYAGAWEANKPYPVIRHLTIPGPCAAFGCIFLPTDLSEASLAAALLHERTHLRKGHTWERTLLLPGQMLVWFHPLVWWLGRELEAVQEYETDAEVIRHIPLKNYGRALLLQATESRSPALLSLFSSTLKQRIEMLTSPPPNRPWRARYSFGLAGLLLVLVLGCTDTATETLPAAVLSLDDYTKLDEPPLLLNPEYADALETTEPERLLLDFVYREIRYPRAVREVNAGGIYNVDFFVDEAGELRDLVVTRASEKSAVNENRIVVIGYGNSTDSTTETQEYRGEELAAEVRRVMNQLPDWQPARQNGQAVPVQMQLSFEFKIE